MADIRKVTDGFAVAPQIDESDVQAIADAGYKTLIANRPDGEGGIDQPRMLDLYYWPTPNGKKVTILLEEMGIDYNVIALPIATGAQFSDDFLKINPNSRMAPIRSFAN